MLNYVLWYLRRERPDLIPFQVAVEPNNVTVYTMGMLQGEHADFRLAADGVYDAQVRQVPVKWFAAP